MGDGDGWVLGPSGERRWGRFGAAGLLLLAGPDGRRREPGGVSEAPVDLGSAAATSGRRVLLQLRAGWTHLGGTWGMPGGAVDSHEDAVAGALREAHEETGVAPDAVEVLGQRVTADLGTWRYTVVLGRLRAGAPPQRPHAATPESEEVRWVDLADVDGLPLHPGLADSWPLLREWVDHACPGRA
ncbi:NUDIX hydrolase [Pseudokineococcus sp. 1T1Z-3]|uniref:NUDIX hydrolase n=1 Tax=Pseudokineococcus sp. 1T1Z-3 TaxID=3132745 RepID=UPI0030B55082